MRWTVRALRLVGAVAAGAVTALPGLVFVLVAVPFAGRPGVRATAARLTGLELRRLRLDLPGRTEEKELRYLAEVAWRVYPSGLDAHGLGEALAGVAERAPVKVTVTCALPERPPSVVEAAAYFVASEAVTNAAKHSGATLVTIDVRQEGTMVVVRAEDDGVGGADATGGGLTGLARRVAALDGRFTVTSPPGGPTVIEAELPCV